MKEPAVLEISGIFVEPYLNAMSIKEVASLVGRLLPGHTAQLKGIQKALIS